MSDQDSTLDENRYLEIGQRPWGNYYVLEDQKTFKVKKLIIKPGQRLSLQSHDKRAEHWVVVSGTATLEVRKGEDVSEWVQEYQPDEYCYVPVGCMHRIANYGDEDLVLVEVQCGNYTGEDDIVRYEDDYGRG